MGVPEHIQAKRKAIIKEACDKYAEKMVAALLVLKASAAVRG